MPVAATDACTNADSTDARLVAAIQISASMARERHNDSAIIAAIWVLPDAPSQSDERPADAELGTSATAEPGTRISAMPRAVSGRSVNPLASGGTSPSRNRGVGSADIPTRASPSAAYLNNMPEIYAQESFVHIGISL